MSARPLSLVVRLTACLFLLLSLGGCLLTQSDTPLLPTGEALPPGLLSRDIPSGLGDTLSVRAEAGRTGTRYVVSSAGGHIGSIAFQKLADLPLQSLSVPGGEARALYLVQARLTGDGLRRLDRRARLSAALSADGDAQRYAYLPLALVRQGTEAPMLALIDCEGPEIDALFRSEATKSGFRFTKDGLLRIGDRTATLRAMRSAIARQIESGTCRAERRLELSPAEPLHLP